MEFYSSPQVHSVKHYHMLYCSANLEASLVEDFSWDSVGFQLVELEAADQMILLT